MLRRSPDQDASGATLLSISKLLARFTRLRRTKLLLRHFPLAKMSTPIAEKVVGPSKSRFEFDEKTKKNIARHSAYCEYLDRLAAGEKGLVDPCLDEDDDTSDDD